MLMLIFFHDDDDQEKVLVQCYLYEQKSDEDELSWLWSSKWSHFFMEACWNLEFPKEYKFQIPLFLAFSI